MWRRVFVRTGTCVARVRTRRRRSGGGCRAGHPAPLARDRGAIRLPCPAAGAAAGGSGVGSSPSSEEAARGYARRAAPVARDLRVGPSGRHARRRDPDCRVSVGRTAVQRGGGAAYRAASRRAVRAEASNPRRQNRGVLSARWSHSPTPPQRLDRRPDQKRPALLIGCRRLGAAELDRKARRRGRCSGRWTGGARSRTGR